MNGDRPDPLERLDATAKAVSGLRDVFAAEEPLEAVMDRVAVTAGKAIPNADAITLTVLDGGEARTVACTDDRVLGIDKQQYAAGRGPCLQAALEFRAVRAVVGEHRERWPEFVEAADQAGIRTYLSLPLLLDIPEDGHETVGAINVYSYTATAFDPFDEGLVKVFTTAAEQAILNARRWQETRDRLTQLETALVSRAEIDQAKGVLMALHGFTAEEAFAKLVEQSQNHNVKVNKLAREFLESVRKK